MKNMDAKKWFLIGIVVILLLALYAVYFFTKYGPPLPWNRMVLDGAEITKTVSNEYGGGTLEISRGSGVNGIFVQPSTRIFDQNRKRIPFERLAVGQHIRAYVSSTVFYEPYDTYVECYRIYIL